MAYQSLLGYAKDGSAEVVALSKGSSMDAINTWAFDAYRNLKFYSPTTGDLNTWLQSNAVKMPLEGTWVFNSTISVDSSASFHVNFSCNGKTYARMAYNSSNVFCYYTIRDASTEVYSSSSWTNTAYRTITFTSPVQYEGNEEFVRWFVDNAAPPPSDLTGTWVFNSSINWALTGDASDITGNVVIPLDFTCEGEAYSTIHSIWKATGGTVYYMSTPVYSFDGAGSAYWVNSKYRIINIPEPFKYTDNPEFYNWFINNATKQS